MYKKIIEKFKAATTEEKNILSIVQKCGPLTKAQILDRTGLKLTTLNRIMKPIIENKFIVETSIGESTGGRKPIIYDINSKFMFLGIEISRIYTQVIITDFKLKVIFKERIHMDSSYSPKKTVNKIKELYEKAILKINRENVIIGGLGTVGPIDINHGIIKNAANFMAKGWVDVNIREMLEEALKLQVYMDNGANSAVTAEYLFGSGKEASSIAYFNFGMGIRTGVIANGNIIRAINEAEDAFAHMSIKFDGKKCICGNTGCVECYASIKAIIESYKNKENENYIYICSAAEKGEAAAYKIIVNSAEIFGRALANFINLISPEVVILSGPLIMASELFYKVSIETAKKNCYFGSHTNISFYRGGHFGENAISIGAVVMAIENMIF